MHMVLITHILPSRVRQRLYVNEELSSPYPHVQMMQHNGGELSHTADNMVIQETIISEYTVHV